jgi:hypothetical protein
MSSQQNPCQKLTLCDLHKKCFGDNKPCLGNKVSTFTSLYISMCSLFPIVQACIQFVFKKDRYQLLLLLLKHYDV